MQRGFPSRADLAAISPRLVEHQHVARETGARAREVSKGEGERERETAPLAARQLRHRPGRQRAIGAAYTHALPYRPPIVVEVQVQSEPALAQLARVLGRGALEG